MAAEVVLITQSNIKEGQEAVYQAYIQQTIPLLAKYGGKVAFVGAGIPQGTHHYVNNAVLTFPSHEAMQQFLSDPAYVELSVLQKAAVDDLHTAYFMTRRRIPEPEQVAQQAFDHFRHGLATGEWKPFLDMLTDDFVFRFPIGEWKGVHSGKDQAAQFFAYVRRAYPDGLFITQVHSVGISAQTVLFEFEDEGMLRGSPYQGRVIVAFEVRDDKICGYREYFGA
jgi:uncharacterized protein (DUF1330 family)/ketosteroid isomerase-like protein